MDENNLSENMAQIAEALNRNTEMLNSMLAFNMAMVPKDQLAKMNLENNIKGQAQAFDILGNSTRGLTREQEASGQSAKIFQAKMNDFKASIDLSQAAVDSFTKAVYSGERSYSKYESTLKSLADATVNLTKDAGYLGKALGVLALGISKVGSAYLEQADNVLKASDQLSKIGNAGAMTAEELLKTAHQSGITSKNLDLLVKPLQNMGTSLTSLGGTASDGIKSFAALTKITNQQREGFQRLGVSQGELIQNQSDYIKLQAMSGKSLTNEMKDKAALQRASLEYTENLLVLSNLSGQDVETIKKKQQEAARAVEAQVAQIQLENKARRLEASGRAEDREAAAKIRKEAEGRRESINMLADSGDQGLMKGVREFLSTGTIASEEGQALGRLGLVEELKKLKAGIAAGGDAQKLTAQFQDKYNKALIGAVDKVGFSASRASEVAKAYNITEESLDNATKKRDRSMENELESSRKKIKAAEQPGKDPAQDARAKMTTAEIEAAKKLDQIVLAGNPLVAGFDKITIALGVTTVALAGLSVAAFAAAGNKLAQKGIDAVAAAANARGLGAAAAPAAARAATSAVPGFTSTASGLLVPASAAAPAAAAPAATAAASSLSSSMSALTKTLGSVSKVLGSTAGAAGVGALVGGYQAYSGYQDANQALKEGKITEQEANKKKGSALGEGAGSVGGAALGAAIGTAILPVVGTAIGGAIGGWLGGKGGELIGETIGAKITTADTAKKDLAEKEKEIVEAKAKRDAAIADQKKANTEEEKAAAARGLKYWGDKLKDLEVEKTEKEKIKNKEEAIQKAKEKIVEAEAKLARSMETASLSQKMGFGREADQKKAADELDAAKRELGKMSNRPASSFESKPTEGAPVPKAADGGIFSGPKSGYPVELHGNEAVVPLSSKTELPDIFGNKFNNNSANSKEERQNAEAFNKSLKDSDVILKKMTSTFSKWNEEIEHQLELKEEENDKLEEFVTGTAGIKDGFKSTFIDLTNFNKHLKIATRQISGSSGGGGGYGGGFGGERSSSSGGGGGGQTSQIANDPSKEESASMITAGETKGVSEKDLEAQGIMIKSGDVQAPNASLDSDLIQKAKTIQNQIPGFKYFSSFNDRYHKQKRPNSKHALGQAIDFTLTRPPTPEEGQQITDQLKKMGFGFVQDEYNNAKSYTTGGHIHAQLSAADGGITSGPSTGYPATLHGNEVIVPLDANSILEKLASTPASQFTESASTTTSTITGTDINDRIIEMLTDKFDVMIARLDDMLNELAESNDTQSDLLKYSKI